MNRRLWLTGGLALLALAGPRRVRAQTPARMYRVGLLAGSAPGSAEAGHVWQSFFEELRKLGYVEGQNLVVEGRYYGDHLDRVASFAAELVRLQVDVIVAAASPAPETARRATSTTPIVMANHSDPVESGLAASLARPGGNVTGLSLRSVEMRVKLLQLLKEILPRLTRVAFLRNPSVPLDVNELEAAARALKLRVHLVDARVPNDLAPALAAARRDGAGALIVLGGSMFFAHRERLAGLGIQQRLPTVYLLKEHVEAGGLLSYGVDLRDTFRRAAGFVDSILKGARPADLPIEQPTKFVLAINLKTARTLGLTIPATVLARADLIVD